ncbi:hypothetical protein L1987_84871 [Smallanthus sonchifolius]|uniref:Uncharacterized protein n=1 Tax=Smallanthus sonchifolius TaxID=185202 RepID=A0ACB8XVK8_9ASTR|nr:hypothetical protein L1987_84871 [Smallanthus sonchifolius]
MKDLYNFMDFINVTGSYFQVLKDFKVLGIICDPVFELLLLFFTGLFHRMKRMKAVIPIVTLSYKMKNKTQ